MPGRLAEKIAIITGAGGDGIGRATARRFAAEGATVVVNDLLAEGAEETVALISAEGGRAEVSAGDASDPAFVDELVRGAVARHGRLDVLHAHMAAGGTQQTLIGDLTVDEWRATVSGTLHATFYAVRSALRVMADAGRGSIICTSSGAALATTPGTGAYGPAKAGILQLVRSAAVEYGPRNVRVNAIIPGAVRTGRLEAFLGTPERMTAYERHIPLRRVCDPDDLANAALFLASDESASITGTSILVDGGVAAVRAVSGWSSD